MSCHSTPGNRAATSLACALARTPSDEVSRRFHELRREAEEQTVTEPTLEEVQAWLERQATAVRNEDGLSTWRREGLLQKIQDADQALTADSLPDPATWYAWQNIRGACDDAAVHAWLASQAGLDVPLTEAQPEDIDDKLAAIWEKIYRERELLYNAKTELTRWRRNIGKFGITQERIDDMVSRMADREARIEAYVDETQPFEREYQRRGGWARYYRVVSSAGGHVHGSMHCSTCYPTTTYGWLPSLSGKGQSEAVDEYGSEMCSVCFPDVLTHPSYQTRGRVAEAAAAARQAERDVRAAEKARKGITTRDGKPLKVGQGRYPDIIATEVTAERTLIGRLTDIRSWYSDAAIEQNVSSAATEEDKTRWRNSLLEQRAGYERDVEALADALASKRGVQPADILSSVEAKVAAKIRRDRR